MDHLGAHQGGGFTTTSKHAAAAGRPALPYIARTHPVVKVDRLRASVMTRNAVPGQIASRLVARLGLSDHATHDVPQVRHFQSEAMRAAYLR